MMMILRYGKEIRPLLDRSGLTYHLPSGTFCKSKPGLDVGHSADLGLVSLFHYPLRGRADLSITKGDRHRVEIQDFLNDTLLEFGLK